MIKNEKAYERPLAFPFLTLRPSFLSLFACRHDGPGSSRVPFTLPSRHEPAHPRSGHFVPVPRFLHPYRSLCVSLTPCPPDPTPVTVTALLPSGSRSCRRFTLGIACQLLPAAPRLGHSPPFRSRYAFARSVPSLTAPRASVTRGGMRAGEERERRVGFFFTFTISIPFWTWETDPRETRPRTPRTHSQGDEPYQTVGTIRTKN